ncbi:MAG: hypothetical protein HYS13_12415 [Planctomycetia bacterium]|nr:hypothetical protein [Planctomycetia bacterium]
MPARSCSFGRAKRIGTESGNLLDKRTRALRFKVLSEVSVPFHDRRLIFRRGGHTLLVWPRPDAIGEETFEFFVHFRGELADGRALPETPFRVSGRSVPDVAAQPTLTNLGRISLGTVWSAEVDLSSRTGREFEVRDVVAPPGVRVAPAEAALPEHRKYKLSGTVEQDGFQLHRLTFKTLTDGDDSEREVRFTVLTHSGRDHVQP